MAWFLAASLRLNRPRPDGTTLYDHCWYDDPENGMRRRPTAAMPFLPAFLAWGILGQMLRRAGIPSALRSRSLLSLVTHVVLQCCRMDNLAWCLFMSFSAILTLRLDRVQGCSPFLWAFSNFSVFYSLALLLLLNLQQGAAVYARHAEEGWRFGVPLDPDRLQPAPDGLIGLFPILPYQPEEFGEGGRYPQECAICCDAFSEDAPICQTPCHVFHVECLQGWFRFRRTCPMCRKDLTCSADDVEVTAVEELSPGFADRESEPGGADSVATEELVHETSSEPEPAPVIS
jgi:hypothetical protein